MIKTTEPGKARVTLYVSGDGPNSVIAIDKLRAICRRQLGSDELIELIDIDEQPERASDENIVFTPLLVICRGDHESRFLGNLNVDAEIIRAISSLRSFHD